MFGIRIELRKKLLRRNADLVEIAAITKLQPARHHVDIESLEILVGDIGRRVRNHRETAGRIVTAMSLAMHVVGLLGTDVAVTACDPEDLLGIVDVHMDLGLALGAGQDQRVTEFSQLFTQLAAIDVRTRYDALGAVTVFRLFVGSGSDGMRNAIFCLDGDAIAQARAGDCTEHARLMVALCRAVGLPAREVGGVTWVPDLEGFGYHAWVEVWVGRWITSDPSWNELPANATHIQMGGPNDVRDLMCSLLVHQDHAIMAIESLDAL